MSPSFSGGPLDAQVGYDPGVDPPADQLAEQMIGPGQDAAPPGGDSPAAKFDRILADARELAASDGNFSEADKLVLEQITTLLQKLKASNEKQVSQAISGKMSPAVGQAYA
jgi:hypothetical protein